MSTSPEAAEREAYEHRMRVWSAATSARAAISAANTQAVTGFASLAINGMILLNISAAGAVLALLGALWGSDLQAIALAIRPAVVAISSFASGAFLAALSAVLAYFCQAYIGDAELTRHNVDTADHMRGRGAADPADVARSAKHARIGEWLRVAAILAGVGGLFAFAAGAGYGIAALLVARDVMGA